VVPNEQGKRGGAKSGRERQDRKGKQVVEPAQKGKRNRSGPLDEARKRASGVIDPNLAVVVKDPLRVHILAIAIQRPISPSEFSREFDCPRWAAAYNFKVLAKHGFLELVEKIPVRGSTKHMYRATKNGYISTQDWGLVAPALQPGIAGAALQDFNGRVTQALELGTFCARDDSYLLWAPITLDEISWPKFVEMMAWAYHEAKELEVETVERRAKGEADGYVPATFAIAGFESPTTKELKAHAKRKQKRRRTQGTSKKKGKGRQEKA
jgi:hypothetical protein